jgi:DNA-binding GntR family transcriptional regulator
VGVYGANLQRISQTVEAVAANDVVAKQLRVEEGFPLLMLSRVLYNAASGKPIEYSQDFLRSDFARIHMEVTLATPVSEVQAVERSVSEVLSQASS